MVRWRCVAGAAVSEPGPRPTLLLIAGWERSGSTIVANVLGSTPGVVTVGEINNIWERGFGADLQCACGEHFGRCPFWAPIGDDAFGAERPQIAARAAEIISRMGNTWLLRRRLPLLGARAADRGAPYAALLAPLYRAAFAHSGARVLVDASKSPWHAAVADGLGEFDVRVLHLVRDPRGVAHSLRKKVRYDTDDDRSIYMDRHSATFSSLAWVYRGALIESTWGGTDRHRFLRYEDFVDDPQRHVAELLDWLGVPDARPTFHPDGSVEVLLSHNISGNPVRFQRGAVQLRQDEAWRTALPTLVRRYVEVLTWRPRRRMGYR